MKITAPMQLESSENELTMRYETIPAKHVLEELGRVKDNHLAGLLAAGIIRVEPHGAKGCAIKVTGKDNVRTVLQWIRGTMN